MWDAELYARSQGHHRAFDDDFLKVLEGPFRRVLDVGCGTGDFTREVLDAFDPAEIVGIDASPEMILLADRTHGAHPRMSFVNVPAEQMVPAFPSASFDLIVSKATLHWIAREHQPGVARGMRELLMDGGRLRLEFGGEGQIGAVRQAMAEEAARFGVGIDGFYFPSCAEYARILRSVGFVGPEVERVEQERSFDSQERLSDWLRSQVLIAYSSRLGPEEFAAFSGRVMDRCLQKLWAGPELGYRITYVRNYVLAVA